MAIRSLDVVRCPPRWLMLRLETDDGLVGWGEALGDHHAAVEAAIVALRPHVVGQDEHAIERLRRAEHLGGFWRDGPVTNAAVSALETALWDLLGQRLGAPVHQLLGGAVRDRIRVYRNVWGSTPERFGESARVAVTEEHLDLVKVSPAGPTPGVPSHRALDSTVDTVAAVREAIGPDHDLAIDLHGRLTPAGSARLLPLLEPFEPLFVEEPCLPGPSDRLRELGRTTSIPFATGERLPRLADFIDLASPSPAVAILQPDLSLVGGLRQGLAIAEVAAAHDLAFAPHCPYGPVQTAAALQLAATTPAHLAQEVQSLGGAGGAGGSDGGGWVWQTNLITQPFEVSDGHVDVPTRPGLGIEVDESVIDELADQWKPASPPRWTLADGTTAEW